MLSGTRPIEDHLGLADLQLRLSRASLVACEHHPALHAAKEAQTRDATGSRTSSDTRVLVRVRFACFHGFQTVIASLRWTHLNEGETR